MNNEEIDTLWSAWFELNEIRVRQGAPDGVSVYYFECLCLDLESMIPEEFQTPWHPKNVRRSQK